MEEVIGPPDLPAGVFRPLRRVEYEAMVEQGLFADTHVELLGGVLVEVSPQGPTHHWLIVELNHRLVHAAGDRYRIGGQVPFALDDISEPEPDFTVLPLGLDRSAIANRTLLAVEVSVTSLAFDLGVKAGRYAAAGIPEYWVVDGANRQVHVHTDPSASGWGSVAVVTGGVLRASVAEDISVDLDDLFASI